MIKQQLFFSLFVLFLVYGSTAHAQENEQDEARARPIKSTVVKRSAAQFTRTYPAVVLPAQQAELSFRFSGRIIELPVRAAAAVEQNDVIARLDPRDFEADVKRISSELEQAQAQFAAMTAGARAEDIAAIEANIDAAKAQLRVTQDQFDRTNKLLERALVTRAQVEDERGKVDVAEANLRARQEELNKALAGARAEEVQAQQAVIRGLEEQLATAKENLADAVLRAPFEGVVAVRQVDNFTNVQANQTIVILQRVDDIELGFDIPAADVSRLATGNDGVKVAQLDAIPGQSFSVDLVEFSTEADRITQTFRARVSMKAPENVVILPGMSGRITVAGEQDEIGEIRIPAVALSSSPDGRAFVWIIDQAENRVSKRWVETDSLSGDEVIIVNGLEDGEMIATAGVSFLQEGMQVRPIKKDNDTGTGS